MTYSIHNKEAVKLGTAISISEDDNLFEILGIRERTLMDLMNELDK